MHTCVTRDCERKQQNRINRTWHLSNGNQTYMYTYMYTYIHTYIHTYVCTYLYLKKIYKLTKGSWSFALNSKNKKIFKYFQNVSFFSICVWVIMCVGVCMRFSFPFSFYLCVVVCEWEREFDWMPSEIRLPLYILMFKVVIWFVYKWMRACVCYVV